MMQGLLNGLSRKAAKLHCSKPFHMRNRTPLASFTFDDVPDSALLNGARILDDCGVRGTFYVASGICGTDDGCWRVVDEDQVRALHGAGHEIGCHTFSHVCVETLDAAAMARESRQNRKRMAEICPDVRMTNFCYPFGKTSWPRKLQLQETFDSCRSIYEGINADRIDLGMLRVIELYDRTLTADKLERVLRETCDRNGWVIFYTHDVTDQPSWIGCSPEKFKATVRTVQATGLRCLAIRDALGAIGYRSAAETIAA